MTVERRTRVESDATSVRCIRPDGSVDEVDWSDLQLVGVETNSAGPFVEDVYIYLEGTKFGFYIPQSAQEEDLLVERLFKLPSFDFEAFCER